MEGKGMEGGNEEQNTFVVFFLFVTVAENAQCRSCNCFVLSMSFRASFSFLELLTLCL